MRQLTPNGHHHAEAFCLMTYACNGQVVAGQTFRNASGRGPDRTAGCGHRETFWNSRDGVTPFCMACPSCGGDLMHSNFSGDVYAPGHKPHTGQGVWRDGTPDEAEAFMRQRIAAMRESGYQCDAEKEQALVDAARSAGDSSEFRKGWPILYRHAPVREVRA